LQPGHKKARFAFRARISSVDLLPFLGKALLGMPLQVLELVPQLDQFLT
jgi:hypothetical protein